MSRSVSDADRSTFLPIACRLVSSDQWLVTHLSTTWSILEVKQRLLDHFSSSDARPPSALRKPARRPLSPLTFSLDRHEELIPGIEKYESDGDSIDDFDLDDDAQWRQFKYSPPPRLSESTSAIASLPSADTQTPERYTLLAFSTGQILEDHFSLAWYAFRPHELLELHPRPHTGAAPVLLPRGTLDAYIRPYFQARVWALRLVDAYVGDFVQLDVPRRTQSRNHGRRDFPDDESMARERRDRRRKKMEWRERWVVIHQGMFKLCKSLNDASPSHSAPLSALQALQGGEQLHPNCPLSPTLQVPMSPMSTPLSSPTLPAHPRPSYALSGSSSAITRETILHGRTNDRVICAKFSAGPHPPPHSPAGVGMAGVPEERRGSDGGISGGWWRRVSRDRDHTTEATEPRKLSKASAESEDGDQEDGTWVVMDMRDEAAFTNLLRILHRHAPAACVSSFAPQLSAAALASGATHVADYSFPPRRSSSSFSSRTPSPTSPLQESDTPRAHRVLNDATGHSLPYPEWRLGLARRARRAGLGAVGRAMELVMFGADDIDHSQQELPTPDVTQDYLKDFMPDVSEQAETSSTDLEAEDSAAGDGDVVIWPASLKSPMERPKYFGDDILDDTSDSESSHSAASANSESDREWEGWSADLTRQRGVQIRAEEKRQHQRERGRWTSGADDSVLWTPVWGSGWGGESDSGDGTADYDGSPVLERKPDELLPPRTLVSYSSADSPFWRTIRGSSSRSRSASAAASPIVTMPIPLPAYARPHSPFAQREEEAMVESYFAAAHREGAMSPPRALYSPRSFERPEGILMPIPISMAMSTIRTSTVSVGSLLGERGQPRQRTPSLQWPSGPRSPVKGWGRRDQEKEKGKGKDRAHDSQGDGSWTLGHNLLRPARLKLSLGLSPTPPPMSTITDRLNTPVSVVSATSLESMKFVSPTSDD